MNLLQITSGLATASSGQIFDFFQKYFVFDLNLWIELGVLAGILVLSIILGIFILPLIFRLPLKFFFKNSPTDKGPKYWWKNYRGPVRILFIGVFFAIFQPMIVLRQEISDTVGQILGIWFIISFTWLGIRTIAQVKQIILKRYDIHQENNLEARKVYTQIGVIEKIVVTFVIIISATSILMTFEPIRQLGVSLLASAGLAGIVVGFAAQKSIANVFAGLQIAITQPIRLDDVVIVEGEWGWIEEITLTYVVVKIWDERRLVVPISFFIEKPFQNWTRTTSQILGSVFLYTDYRVPLESLRNELTRILKGSPLWDGRVNGIQVTNATEKSVEIRALMSSATSPKAWDLRCLVREKMLTFLQENYPESLPRSRVELLEKESV